MGVNQWVTGWVMYGPWVWHGAAYGATGWVIVGAIHCHGRSVWGNGAVCTHV